jgi:polar amino acid transport system substrate-binding protein
MRWSLVATALICMLALAGCQFPADPEGTLNRVRDGVMRVGVVENDPWVRVESGKGVGGVEVRLLEAFAREQNARIEWVEGSESELVAALEGTQIDVLAAGLDRTSVWARKVALTAPYLEANLVLAAPPGKEVPENLEGVNVAVEKDGEGASLLEQRTDAKPAEVETLDGVDGPALVWDYELEALGLESSGRIMDDVEHCMAVSFGENAFMVELEHFLLDHGDEAERILREEAAR